MKHVKVVCLAAMAAMVLMGLVGAAPASATALYNGMTKLGIGSTVDLSLSGTTKQTNTSGTETLAECSGSTIKVKVTNAGGSGVAAVVGIEELTWTNCTVPTSTDTKGGLDVSQIGTSTEGTVKANSEIRWTINTIFFGTCAYGFKSGSHLGTIKTSTSGSAQWNMSAVVVKLSGSNFVCPETTKLVATYTSTEPVNLRVEGS